MFDDEALGGTRPPSTTNEPTDGDADESAELSKAAREAVRQPPDPRLEAQFARLLGSEPAPKTPASVGPARPDRRDGPAADPSELAGLAEALAAVAEAVAAVQARAAEIERRVVLVTRLLGVTIAVLAILTVVILVR